MVKAKNLTVMLMRQLTPPLLAVGIPLFYHKR